MNPSSNTNDVQNLSDSPESDCSLTSAHGLQKSSSKFVLSQSKKPSGAIKSKDQEDANELEAFDNDSIKSNELENKNALELRLQVKEMRMEMERRETELKDLQVCILFHFPLLSSLKIYKY